MDLEKKILQVFLPIYLCPEYLEYCFDLESIHTFSSGPLLVFCEIPLSNKSKFFYDMMILQEVTIFGNETTVQTLAILTI